MAGPDASLLRRALAAKGRASSDYDLNPDDPGRASAALRPAAVLIAVGPLGDVVLTKRSSRLHHHPGQIALPGGRLDPGDAGPEAAALREAGEEIGLDPGLVEVLGTMPAHETVTGFSVVPVLAMLRDGFVPIAEAGEVDEVFTVPLAHLADPANYRIEGRVWRGSFRRYYVVPYGPYYIWGATARILRGVGGSDGMT